MIPTLFSVSYAGLWGQHRLDVESFIHKAGAQRMAAELGLAIVVCDTSPRGESVPDDPAGAYDFGLGAGFYLNATQAPWREHYRMHDYVVHELPELVEAHFPISDVRGIAGHSMGGHGALTVALNHPDRFRSVSAFAPIVSPGQVPWGQKALGGYLGDDRATWRKHDTVALIDDGARVEEILVDVGLSDPFIEKELRPELLEQSCKAAGIALTLRRHAGYDHSYYFISTFMADHIAWHAERLKRG